MPFLFASLHTGYRAPMQARQENFAALHPEPDPAGKGPVTTGKRRPSPAGY